MNPLESGGRGTGVRDGYGKPEDVSAAIRYVIDEQGDPMSVFEKMVEN